VHQLDELLTAVLQAAHHPTVNTVLDLAVRGRLGATASYADYLRLVGSQLAGIALDAPKHEISVKSILVAFDRFRILCAVHEGEWGTIELSETQYN
jgi:exodeoxyribonuclease V alpha subunit